MEKRQKSLLNLIIREYIKSAEPVGSQFVVKKGGFNLSPATIRNEMAALEDKGYIYQPYTSAGRVPTEKGYRFYIDNLLRIKEPTLREKRYLKMALREKAKDEEIFIKTLAKALAELSVETVLIGFNPNNVFYTGLTNLFSQPEFANRELIYNISLVIDHLDEVIHEIFNRVGKEIEILIGKENPFAEDCGVIITKYSLPHFSPGIIGILGPIRMDYENNFSLLNYAQKILSNIK